MLVSGSRDILWHHLMGCNFAGNTLTKNPTWLVVSNIFLFSPRFWGKWSKLTSIFFNGVVQPPTRLCHDQNVGPHVWSMDSVTSGNQVQFLFHREKNPTKSAKTLRNSMGGRTPTGLRLWSSCVGMGFGCLPRPGFRREEQQGMVKRF